MKKKILSMLLAFVLLLSLLSLSGCGAEKKYDYEDVSTHVLYASLKDEFKFIYEDTRLNIYDDGTWSIDESIFLFFRSKIDKGTYTVEDGLYTFEGFEYGMKATGKETDDGGFEIYFSEPVEGVGTVVTLRFCEN